LNGLRPSLRATQKFGQLNQIPHFGQLFRIKNRLMFCHELSAHILSTASPRDGSSRSLHSANAQRQTANLRFHSFHSALPTFNSFLFILMQTPFPATPFFSCSYKCPGGVRVPLAASELSNAASHRPLLLFALALSPCAATHLLASQYLAHSSQKQQGCTLLLPGFGIAPRFLPALLLRYTRLVAFRSLFPWTSASPRPPPPSPISKTA